MVSRATGCSDLRLEALLAYMRRNCSDPDLSPSAATAHLRISVRTVHKLMKQTERSFGEWLLDERLHRCVHMLTPPYAEGDDASFVATFADLVALAALPAQPALPSLSESRPRRTR